MVEPAKLGGKTVGRMTIRRVECGDCGSSTHEAPSS